MAVLIEVEPPRHARAPNAATALRGGRREAIRHHPSSGATPLVRAKALPKRVEAPAGLACPSPFPLPGSGLIQPAGRARPQIGLQPTGGTRRWNSRNPGKGQHI